MGKRKFGVGLVIGGIAGLVAGLLTAPKSGKETREDLKRKADKVKTETAKHAEEVREKATEVADQAKETAQKVKEVADTAAEGMRRGFGATTKTDKPTATSEKPKR